LDFGEIERESSYIMPLEQTTIYAMVWRLSPGIR